MVAAIFSQILKPLKWHRNGNLVF